MSRPHLGFYTALPVSTFKFSEEHHLCDSIARDVWMVLPESKLKTVEYLIDELTNTENVYT